MVNPHRGEYLKMPQHVPAEGYERLSLYKAADDSSSLPDKRRHGVDGRPAEDESGYAEYEQIDDELQHLERAEEGETEPQTEHTTQVDEHLCQLQDPSDDIEQQKRVKLATSE